MNDNPEPLSIGFETDKLWAIGYAIGAFLSLASGGILGAIAFGVLAFESIANHEQEEDGSPPLFPVFGSEAQLPAAVPQSALPPTALTSNAQSPAAQSPTAQPSSSQFPVAQSPTVQSYNAQPYNAQPPNTQQEADPFQVEDGAQLYADEGTQPYTRQEFTPQPRFIPPSPPPVAPIQLNPHIHNHNYIPGSSSASQSRVKVATPPQSDRRTQAPDLSLYRDARERMQVLLKAMHQSGFPLGTLLHQPFVWCWGRSQSGKTTMALMLSMARMALGHRVGYLSTDKDFPHNLGWFRMEDSPEGYSCLLDEIESVISSAEKGELRGTGWVLDEMYAASSKHEISIQPILRAVLMKGSKTGCGIVGISQTDTSSAHGLKGIDAAWRDERVSIQAIHETDTVGTRHPTGRYIVSTGEESQEWFIPEWMLSELNQWGTPDPVVWMMNRFPELVNRNSPRFNPSSASRTSTVQDASRRVQPGSDGSTLNRVVQPDEPLNLAPEGDVQGHNPNGSRFVNQRFSEEEARAEVVRLKSAKLNQDQIIEVLWGVKKGGSEAYRQAHSEYKYLMGER